MKDIKDFINESNKGWEFFPNVTDQGMSGITLPGLSNKNIKWLLINPQSEIISGVTERDLASWTEDDDSFEYAEKAIKALKIGESFDADGGINIYIRIKK